MDRFLTKPIAPATLRDLIRDLPAWRRLHPSPDPAPALPTAAPGGRAGPGDT